MAVVAIPTRNGEIQFGPDSPISNSGSPIEEFKRLVKLAKEVWNELQHPGSHKIIRNAAEENLRTIYIINGLNEIDAKINYKYAHPPSRVENLDSYRREIRELLLQQEKWLSALKRATGALLYRTDEVHLRVISSQKVFKKLAPLHEYVVEIHKIAEERFNNSEQNKKWVDDFVAYQRQVLEFNPLWKEFSENLNLIYTNKITEKEHLSIQFQRAQFKQKVDVVLTRLVESSDAVKPYDDLDWRSAQNGINQHYIEVQSLWEGAQWLELNSLWKECFENLSISYNPQVSDEKHLEIQTQRTLLKQNVDDCLTRFIRLSDATGSDESTDWHSPQNSINRYYIEGQSNWKGWESLHYVETLRFSKAKQNLPHLLPEDAAAVRFSIARGEYEVASVVSGSARLVFQFISSYLPTPQKKLPGALVIGLVKSCFLVTTDPKVSDFWIRRLVISYPKDFGQSGRISRIVSFVFAGLTTANEVASPIFQYLGSENPEMGLLFHNRIEMPLSIGLQIWDIGTRTFGILTSSVSMPFSITSVACSVASLALSCESFTKLEKYQFSISDRTVLETARRIGTDLGIIQALTPIATFCEGPLTKAFLNESLSSFSKRLITKIPGALISLAGRVALISEPELLGGPVTRQLLVEFLKSLAGRLTVITLPAIPDWAISIGWITLFATYRIWHDSRKIRASYLMQTAHTFLSLELHEEAQQQLFQAKGWNFGDTDTIERYSRCITFIKRISFLTTDKASQIKVTEAMKDIDTMLSIAQDIEYYSWLRGDLLYYKVVANLKIEDYKAATSALQRDGNTQEIFARVALYVVAQAQELVNHSKHEAAEALLKNIEEPFDATYKNLLAKYREYIGCCKAKIYCARVGFEDLDSARQSKIEAKRSERRSPAPSGQGEEEDRFDEVVASPNLQNLAARSIDEEILQAVEAIISVVEPMPTLVPIKNFFLPICEELRYTALCNLFDKNPKDPEVSTLFGKLSLQTQELFVFRLIQLAENLCLQENYNQAHEEFKNICEQMKLFSYHGYFIGELLPRFLGYLASKAKHPILTETSPTEEIQDRLFRIDRVSRFAKKRPSSPELSQLHVQLQYEKVRLCIDTGKSKEASLIWAQEDLHPQISVRVAAELISKASQLQQQRDAEALAYLEKMAPYLKGFRHLDFFDRYRTYLRCDPSSVERIAAIDELVSAAKLIDSVVLSGFHTKLQCDKFSLCLTHKKYQVAKQLLDQPGIDADVRLEWTAYLAQHALNEVTKRLEESGIIRSTSAIFAVVIGLIDSIDKFSWELSLDLLQQSDLEKQDRMSKYLVSMKRQKEQLQRAIGEIEESNGHIPEARKAYLICRQLLIELGEAGREIDIINYLLSRVGSSGEPCVEKSTRITTSHDKSQKKQSVPVRVREDTSKENTYQTQTITMEEFENRFQNVIQEVSQRNREIEKRLKRFKWKTK